MIRRANPEIARGEYKALSFEGTNAGGFLCTWNGKTVGVFHNPGKKEAVLEMPEDVSFEGELEVIGKSGASWGSGVLTLGSQTSAVLR